MKAAMSVKQHTAQTCLCRLRLPLVNHQVLQLFQFDEQFKKFDFFSCVHAAVLRNILCHGSAVTSSV